MADYLLFIAVFLRSNLLEHVLNMIFNDHDRWSLNDGWFTKISIHSISILTTLDSHIVQFTESLIVLSEIGLVNTPSGALRLRDLRKSTFLAI